MRRHLFRNALGIIVAVAGVLWMLQIVGVLTFDLGALIATYWPVLLIVWGLLQLWERAWGGRSGYTGAVGNIAIGALLTAANLHVLHVRSLWDLILALLVIVVGLEMIRGRSAVIFRHRGRRRRQYGDYGWTDSQPPGPFDLEDTHVRQSIGSLELDLRQARIREGETSISADLLMGSIDILVPSDLPISVKASSTVGSVEVIDRISDGMERSLDFTSDGYASATRRVVLDLHTALGSVKVSRSN